MTESMLFFDGKPGSRRRAMNRRRQAILDSALDVFSQKGYFQADVEEIAHLAHVSKGSIYNHFQNKKDLFVKTLVWGIDLMAETIDNQILSIDDPYKRLISVMRSYFEFFDRNVELFRVLILERELFENNTHNKTLRILIEKRLRVLEELINHCVEADVFVDLPAYDCAVMILGASNGLIFDWITNKRSGKVSDITSIIESFFFKRLLK